MQIHTLQNFAFSPSSTLRELYGIWKALQTLRDFLPLSEDFTRVILHTVSQSAVTMLTVGRTSSLEAQPMLRKCLLAKDALPLPLEIRWSSRETPSARAAEYLTRLHQFQISPTLKRSLIHEFRLKTFPKSIFLQPKDFLTGQPLPVKANMLVVVVLPLFLSERAYNYYFTHFVQVFQSPLILIGPALSSTNFFSRLNLHSTQHVSLSWRDVVPDAATFVALASHVAYRAWLLHA